MFGFYLGFLTKTVLRVLMDFSSIVLMADKHKENKEIIDNMDELLRGLFKVLETDKANANAACLCLVNISSKENGLKKIMSVINSNISSNDSVGFVLKENLYH